MVQMFVRPRWLLLAMIAVHFASVWGNPTTPAASQVSMATTERGDIDEPSNAQVSMATTESGDEPSNATVTTASPDINGTVSAPLVAASEDSDHKSILYWLSDKLFLYAIPVITGVGFVGNGFVFVIMNTANFRTSPVSVFMAALACADSSVLVLDFLNNWVEVVFEVNFLDSMEWFCKLHRFLFDVCYTYSAWLVAGVAVERCIAVWFPFHAKRFCTVKTSRVIVSVMPVILSFIYLHNLWGWVTRNGRCDIRGDFQAFQESYGPWISAVLYSWVPIVILIVSNVAIIVKLSTSQKNRKAMGAEKIDTYRITVTVLIVCTCFVLLTVPLTLFYIVLFAKQMFNAPSPSMAMGRTLVLILGLSNHAINFFLYGLSLAKFRAELRRLLCCRSEHSGDRSAPAAPGSSRGSPESGRTTETRGSTGSPPSENKSTGNSSSCSMASIKEMEESSGSSSCAEVSGTVL